MADSSASVCPRYHRAVELIGRRWTGAIVNLLLQGRRRFNEIANGIPDISDRMLAERLRELESEAIVMRIADPEVPIRVEYELTDKGRSLEKAVTAIAQWAEHWITDEDLRPPGRLAEIPVRPALAKRGRRRRAGATAKRHP